MKERRSSCHRYLWILGLLLAMVIGSMHGVQAQAASRYSIKSEKLSGTNYEAYFVDQKTGRTVDHLSMRVCPSAAAANSGSLIYFSGSFMPGVGKNANTLFSYHLKTKKLTKLKSLSAAFFEYDVNEVNNGKVYLSGWNPSDNMALYEYTISTGKIKKIAKSGYAKRYKQYIICDSTKVHGSYCMYPIYVYNTQTGKRVTVTKKAGAYRYSKGCLYVAIPGRFPSDTSKTSYKIIRYQIAKGISEVLNKKLMAYFVTDLTGKYVYHTNWKTKYRQAIKTGKESVIS